jgi:Arc/MetJ-type ribon-helix-helix transcriptional regulator
VAMTKMTIHMPDEVVARIEQLVADGEFPDSDAVVRKAIATLEWARERERLVASLQDAEKSIEDGRGFTDSDDYWNGLPERARARRESGEPINLDVQPLDR